MHRPFMWYKNVGRKFFRFVTMHAFEGQTDGRTDGFAIAIPLVHTAPRWKPTCGTWWVSSDWMIWCYYIFTSRERTKLTLPLLCGYLWIVKKVCTILVSLSPRHSYAIRTVHYCKCSCCHSHGCKDTMLLLLFHFHFYLVYVSNNVR